ncbi:S8 family serine peptidase [Erysipelotrichaceae bacterium OttesenSCG-928-M19]|nr:S8 family serine peptidase [Erysipelotrichaceae bacterium OttesenSCG-928-M19]
MKRNRLVLIVLLVAIIAMILLVVRDVNTSKYLENKGKSAVGDGSDIIAIIDSGANIEQVNYDKKLKITSYNAIDGSDDITDEARRGTMLFSSLYNDNYSMDLENDVMLIKAFDSLNDIRVGNVIKALNYACDNKASVVNLSFEIPADSNLEETIKTCQFKGTTVVAANFNKDELGFPANIKDVISVDLVSSTVDSRVKVDMSEQQVCLDNVCKNNNHIDLSTAYVSGYLLNFKDKQKESNNLVLKPSYNISRIDKK